jgi:hypothetical protein
MSAAATTMLVPGNHDVYTFTARRRERLAAAFPTAVPAQFPCVRPLIGGWKLLAVDSAAPRLLDSRGRVGERQLREVENILRAMSGSDGVLVLCHYPIGKPPELPPMKTGHRLLDDDRWREVIATSTARVVLVHGHVHCPWLWRVSGMRNVLDVNAGAPTMVMRARKHGAQGARPDHSGGSRGQGFWEMTLAADPSQPIGFAHHPMDDGSGDCGPPVISGIENAWRVDGQHETSGRRWTIRRISVT